MDEDHTLYNVGPSQEIKTVDLMGSVENDPRSNNVTNWKILCVQIIIDCVFLSMSIINLFPLHSFIFDLDRLFLSRSDESPIVRSRSKRTLEVNRINGLITKNGGPHKYICVCVCGRERNLTGEMFAIGEN